MRWILAAFVLVLTSCGERTNDAVRDDGPRIVSLSPAASIMLREAGLEASIVGRHGWDAVLDQSLPVAGDQTGIDYERLIGLAPTHVVIEWGERELPPRLVSLASERSIEVIQIETLTLADIAASAKLIGATFDAEGGAPMVFPEPADESRLAWGSVLLVVATSPSVDCLGPGSAHHELLLAGGFEPTIAEGAPWMTLSVEDAIALDPACVVLIQPGGSPDAAAGSIEQRLGPLAGTDITAVRLGRVVLIDDPLALIPSTNLIGLGERMRARLIDLGPLPSPHDD